MQLWDTLIEEKSYVSDWSVKSVKQCFNWLGRQVPKVAAIPESSVILSLGIPSSTQYKDHSCFW